MSLEDGCGGDEDGGGVSGCGGAVGGWWEGVVRTIGMWMWMVGGEVRICMFFLDILGGGWVGWCVLPRKRGKGDT